MWSDNEMACWLCVVMSCCTVIMPYCTELPSHVLLCRSTLCCTVLFRVLFCLVIFCLAMPSRFFALYCGGSRPILFIYVVSLFLCRFVYSSSLKRAVSSKQLLLMFIYVYSSVCHSILCSWSWRKYACEKNAYFSGLSKGRWVDISNIAQHVTDHLTIFVH